ncbi:MAG TPA: hypothetical protein H9784_10475 [Candidatus Desulfovibrio intestinavium]|uniref:Uncharacterized protein n=1 Tax=Candidatus Desulfovibrio intestinavium TaxID=2838534 RepID=A0A9D2HN47_9BACT|nr:hypothetical protein [Candidatus Desulfovibrio intestinavium]
MSGAISDEVLSIVRNMLSSSPRYVTLPSHVVSAMVKRIDLQDKRLHANRLVVDCHDKYFGEVDKTTAVFERFNDDKKAELHDHVKHEQG